MYLFIISVYLFVIGNMYLFWGMREKSFNYFNWSLGGRQQLLVACVIALILSIMVLLAYSIDRYNKR